MSRQRAATLLARLRAHTRRGTKTRQKVEPPIPDDHLSVVCAAVRSWPSGVYDLKVVDHHVVSHHDGGPVIVGYCLTWTAPHWAHTRHR